MMMEGVTTLVFIFVSSFRWTFETHGVSNFAQGSAGTPTKSCEAKGKAVSGEGERLQIP